MTNNTSTHTFTEFKSALAFLQQERRIGNHAIYYPRGGDNPRKLITDPVEHIVLVMKDVKK